MFQNGTIMQCLLKVLQWGLQWSILVMMMCITKTEKAESEAQRGKPKGTLESVIRNAMS